MAEQRCKDCGLVLAPHSETCPACGDTAASDSDYARRVQGEYLACSENQVPETYPGY